MTRSSYNACPVIGPTKVEMIAGLSSSWGSPAGRGRESGRTNASDRRKETLYE
ncbi:MAG: hypothetical protein P8N43_09820 [Alphaproteobacteria bacterium]|nr:hypothetical protein [Alphaproteobacteria bacterium]